MIFIPGTSCSRTMQTSSSWIGRVANGATRQTISPRLTINYLFFSLQRSGRLDGNLRGVVLTLLAALSERNG